MINGHHSFSIGILANGCATEIAIDLTIRLELRS